MKQTLTLIFITALMGFALNISAQEEVAATTETVAAQMPSIPLKTLKGQTVNIQDFLGNGKITVISFWATWCSPCKRELDAIADIYEEWQEDHNVELLAITIDDARSLAKVPALVETKGWDYTILADSKRELQKALNFQTVPQTFLVDQDGNIVYTHTGYNPGDELELEDEIIKISAK